MITSRQFAEMIGVSQSAVSRALNDGPSISNETRDYIRRKAEEYGFVLNSHAKSLRTNKTATVGVLFPLHFDSLSRNLMFTNIYDHLQRELIQRDYDIMVIYDYKGSSGANAFERIVKSRKVDGIINFRSKLLPREVSLIENYHIPFVSLHSARQDNPNLHQLMIDKRSAGDQAAAFFTSFSLDRYLYLSADTNGVNASQRLSGYRDGLLSRGCQLPPEHILSCSLSMASARETILQQKDLLSQGQTGIFVYNDMLALGVVNALHLLGISVPEQVQIIGMDDIPMATWMLPELSTLHSPVSQMVRDGCDLLFDMIDGKALKPQSILYPPRLILRDTTRPLP